MTFQEFKAWFDGYAEHVKDVPTPEQWARVREQLAIAEWAGRNKEPDPGTASVPRWPSTYYDMVSLAAAAGRT